MATLHLKPAKTELYALVRDSQGKPKFDDINNIPGAIWGMLSTDEQREIMAQRKNPKPLKQE